MESDKYHLKEKEEILSNKYKSIFFDILSIFFIFLSLLIISDGRELSDRHPNWFVLSAAYIMLPLSIHGLLFFIYITFKPMRLVLDLDGFILHKPFVKKQVRWKDVDGFFMERVSRFNKMLAYRLKPEVRKKSIFRKLNRGHGSDGTLPGLWPISQLELLEKLKAWKARSDSARLNDKGAPCQNTCLNKLNFGA